MIQFEEIWGLPIPHGNTGGNLSGNDHQQMIPSQIAPSVWVGPYGCLVDQDFMSQANIKFIVNCSPTYTFLNMLEHSNVIVSSDTIILSLDPSFSTEKFSEDEQMLLNEFISKFNRILQNFITHFYKANPNSGHFIHDMPNRSDLSLSSPILAGGLQQHFFNINRLVKLLRNINQSIGVLFVSVDGNDQLSMALAMSYLMDNYNYNLIASFNSLKTNRPSIRGLNPSYYDDLLIIDNLKKFHQENTALKQHNPGILMSNCKLKRRNVDDNDEMVNMVACGDYRKRRLKYPAGI